jgi:MraZ protein
MARRPKQMGRRVLLKTGLEQMFLGEFTHAIDDKGRLTIPAKFREALAQGAVVTRGFDKNLVIYTSDTFTHLAQRATALSPTDPNHRALLRLTFSGASEAESDKQGRVNIPPFLREYAALDGECVVVGVGDYIEVWSKAGWAEQLQQINDVAANAQRFAALDLATGDTPPSSLP